jgi:hypothetical protein
MSDLDIQEASIILGLPPFLIRDMMSLEFNGRKLPTKPGAMVDRAALELYSKHLEAAWPADKRDPPIWVVRYLIWESGSTCGLCRESKPNYDIAHIREWAKTHCHSPKNLLRLCVDCHRSHGDDQKLLQGVKEGLMRERSLLTTDLLYECSEDVAVGDAVVLRDGVAQRAAASSQTELSAGFVRTKVGPDRCSVVRLGLVVGLAGLTTGWWYFLSPSRPGRIGSFYEVLDEYDALRRAPGPQFWWQRVGRAESSSHLFIQMTQGIGMPSATGPGGI